MFISDAPPGASFRVVRVTSVGEVGKRLADMGFTQGAEGAVVRAGFLRGPLQVRICGYDILIRRAEAASIEVEPIGDWTAAADAQRGWMGDGFGRGGGRGPGRGLGRGRGFGGRRGFGASCSDDEGAR